MLITGGQGEPILNLLSALGQHLLQLQLEQHELRLLWRRDRLTVCCCSSLAGADSTLLNTGLHPGWQCLQGRGDTFYSSHSVPSPTDMLQSLGLSLPGSLRLGFTGLLLL